MRDRLQAVDRRLKQVAQAFLSVLVALCIALPAYSQDGEAIEPPAEAAPVALPAIVDPNPGQALQYAEIEVARYTSQLAAMQAELEVVRLEGEKARAELEQAHSALALLTVEVDKATALVNAAQASVAPAVAALQVVETAQQLMASDVETARQALAATEQALAEVTPLIEQARQALDSATAAKSIVDETISTATQRMADAALTPEQQAAAAAQLQQAQLAQGLTDRLAADATAAHETIVQQTAAARVLHAEAQLAYDNTLAAQTQVAAELTVARNNVAVAEASVAESQALLTQSQAAQAVIQARIDELNRQLQERQSRVDPVQSQVNTMQALLDVSTKRRDAFAATLPVADPTQIREVAVYQEARPLMCVGFDPAGEYIFAGAQDNTILRWRIWDQYKDVLTGHRSWPSQLVVASTGVMYSTGHEGTLLKWEALAHPPSLISTTDAHEGFARALAVSPDGQLVVTVGNDNKAKVWNAADGAFITELVGHESHIYNLAFHPSGEYLVTGDLKGVLKQWRVGTWEFVRDLNADVVYKYDDGFQADVGGVRGICFSPDGSRLAVGGMGNVSNAFAGVGNPMGAVFNFETGERLQVLSTANNFEGAIWGMEFDPHGRYIVAVGGGNSGALWFWRVGEEQSFHQFDLPGIAYDVAVHPDGLKIAVALYDNTVRVYELLTDPLATPVALPDPPTE
jgi:WD40 repeat protein